MKHTKHNVRSTKLKRHKEGEEMPGDFYNYDINPITGFKVQSRSYYHINK